MKSAAARLLKTIGSGIYTVIALLGGYISNVLFITFRCIGKGLYIFFKIIWSVTERFRKWAADKLKKFGLFIAKPVISIIGFFDRIILEYRNAKKSNGGKAKLIQKLSLIGNIIFGKRGIAVVAFSVAVPVVSIFFLFSVITYASSVNYAVKLSVNGKFLGYIENEQVFYDAKEVLQERINYLGNTTAIDAEPSYAIEQVGSTELLTKYEIADLIMQNSGVSFDYGYGFYINDVFFGALSDFSRVQSTLDRLLKKNETDDPTEQISFVDNIRYNEAGQYLSESFIDENWLIRLLTGTKHESSYYTVEYGDSHSLIADKVDVTTEELNRLNPGFSDTDLHVGDLIKIDDEVPYLSVSITRTETYTVDSVPYETETYQSNDYYLGSSRVMQKGQTGQNSVTANVTYVNGMETGRDITHVETISEPVTEIIAIGTKETPEGTFKGGSAAYGKFMWPVNGGYISQWAQWDGGYSGHKGIDIAGLKYGQPVYAGAGGIVTDAGWSSGLGYYVMIYHEDLGVTSIYGHNSSLFVTKGQRVAQGECIAGAGNTGISTGIHVHFGIQINGTSVNPRAYLDIPEGTKIQLA
ncbi:MAG: peptidoglycan DD-metalloendopeptidase family protein [Firmicutes bacterium]|nr:peptidoglycan DD-metalloendopeptidase family protein [[Eubacterium] siraeum]MCM1488147.1 peptidoglycan DD-metalloendopeptidase family protein [Bacillota bacterium]